MDFKRVQQKPPTVKWQDWNCKMLIWKQMTKKRKFHPAAVAEAVALPTEEDRAKL